MATDRVEITAKTVEAAVAEALAALGATKDEVIITVSDPGNKGGLFGFGSKPAKVLVERKNEVNPEEFARKLLAEITSAMGLSIQIESFAKDRYINIDMKGENMGLLIGKRGHTLDSLQYLVNLAVNQRSESSVSVILDTENYRRRRRETLETLAHSIARKVKATKKSVSLEPMSRFERHVIHTALQGDRSVRTSSEGNELQRHVVVSPK